MKKLVIAVITGSFLLSMTACSMMVDDNGSEMETVQNPMTGYDILEEAETAAGFEIELPENIEGYTTPEIYMYELADTAMLEITYQNDSSSLTIRKEPMSGEKTTDISGVYESYPEEKEVNVDNTTLVTKGDVDNAYVVVWSDGIYDFSIYADSGITEEEAIELFRQIG